MRIRTPSLKMLTMQSQRFLEITTACGERALSTDRFDWAASIRQVPLEDWPEVVFKLRGQMVRPLIQLAFVECWVMGLPESIPNAVKPTLCRLLFPLYRGPDRTLYRGCRQGKERGMSWTGSRKMALRFAKQLPRSTPAIVLEARVSSDAIMADIGQYMKRRSEDELVVDPDMLPSKLTVVSHTFSSGVRLASGSIGKGKSVFSAFRRSFFKDLEKLRDAER